MKAYLKVISACTVFALMLCVGSVAFSQSSRAQGASSGAGSDWLAGIPRFDPEEYRRSQGYGYDESETVELPSGYRGIIPEGMTKEEALELAKVNLPEHFVATPTEAQLMEETATASAWPSSPPRSHRSEAQGQQRHTRRSASAAEEYKSTFFESLAPAIGLALVGGLFAVFRSKGG